MTPEGWSPAWFAWIGDLPNVTVTGFAPHLPSGPLWDGAACHECRQPLSVLGGHKLDYGSPDGEEGREVGWLCWGRCPGCARIYIRRIPMRPHGPGGWEHEPHPPSYIGLLGRSDVKCKFEW